MTDYAAMTDAELNRRVAEALGYRVEFHEHTSRREDSYGESWLSGDYPGYVCLDPDETYESAYREYEDGFPEGFDTEELAWENGVAYAEYSPSFSLFENQVTFTLTQNMSAAPEARWVAYIGSDIRNAQYVVTAAANARGLAECWLAWKEGAG